MPFTNTDLGSIWISALRVHQRFITGLHVSPSKLTRAAAVEDSYTHHMATVNDISSLNKEFRDSQYNNTEGAALNNAVAVLASDAALPFDAAKRILWSMRRKWEVVHDRLVDQLVAEGCSPELKAYLDGLKLQMCGHELWCTTTFRYKYLELTQYD